MDPEEIFPQGSKAPQTRDIVARTIGLGSGKQWDKLEYIAERNFELLNMETVEKRLSLIVAAQP